MLLWANLNRCKINQTFFFFMVDFGRRQRKERKRGSCPPNNSGLSLLLEWLSSPSVRLSRRERESGGKRSQLQWPCLTRPTLLCVFLCVCVWVGVYLFVWKWERERERCRLNPGSLETLTTSLCPWPQLSLTALSREEEGRQMQEEKERFRKN